MLRIYSELLNSSNNYNPDVAFELYQWLRDCALKILSDVQETYRQVNDILTNTLTFQGRIIEVVKKLATKNFESVKILIQEWVNSNLKIKLSELDDSNSGIKQLKSERETLFLQKMDVRKLGDILQTIFQKADIIRNDLFDSLIPIINSYIKNSDMSIPDKEYHLKFISSSDQDLKERIKNVFSLIVNARGDLFEKFCTKFKDFLQTVFTENLVILEKTNAFENSFELFEDQLYDKDKLFDVLNHFLQLKPRKIFYKLQVHKDLTPKDIKRLILPFVKSAEECKNNRKMYVFTLFMVIVFLFILHYFFNLIFCFIILLFLKKKDEGKPFFFHKVFFSKIIF